MGEFGGWDMPIQYAGILAEHAQTRARASLFDICHMGELELSGPSAMGDLERLLTCSVETLAVGQVRYGYLLDDGGGVLDDLTVYRLEAERYWLVVNAGTAERDVAWIEERLSEGTVFVDRSEEVAKLDLQGPLAREVLEAVCGISVGGLGYFRCALFDSMWVSRTGYTGELGFELYLPVEEAGALWEALLAHEACEPAGLGARDTLRLEMGYPLYGHELDEAHSPVATGGGAFMDLSKPFVGRERVEADLAVRGERVVGLRFDSKRAAREGDGVFLGEQGVGCVTSGSLAPSLGVAVAMARVDVVASEVGAVVEVEIRGRRVDAVVVALPFYTEGTARGSVCVV